MGWSGRAPAPPAIEAGKGRQDKERAMSQTLNAAIAVVGIDSAYGLSITAQTRRLIRSAFA
jgi:hypothetical protein